MNLFRWILVSLFLLPAGAQPANSSALLRERLSLLSNEVDAALAGERIVRTLDTKEPTEVAVFGVVKVNAPLDLYLHDVGRAKVSGSGRGILKEGRFSRPARLPDLQALTVDPDTPEEFNSRDLVELVNRYYKGRYDVAPLLPDDPYLKNAAPALARYLAGAPGGRPANLKQDVITWSKVNFGLKSFVRVNHRVMLQKPLGKDREVFIASMQLFASRYFDAALELQDLIEDRSNPNSPVFYFITVNRARSSALSSVLGRLLRSTVVNSTRTSTEKTLDFIKSEYEAQYQRSKSGAGKRLP
jgi:hypothetical protein